MADRLHILQQRLSKLQQETDHERDGQNRSKALEDLAAKRREIIGEIHELQPLTGMHGSRISMRHVQHPDLQVYSLLHQALMRNAVCM